MFRSLPPRLAADQTSAPESLTTGQPREVLANIVAFIAWTMATDGTSGMSVKVVRGSQVINAEGFGFAESEAGRAVTPDKLFCTERCFAHRRLVIATAVLVMVAGVGLATRLGGEFIPRLDEGDISISAIRPPSVAISEVAASTGRIERVLKRFPEAITIVSRSGSPELATDVMGIELGDVFVILKPISDWTTARTKGELIEKMNEALTEAVPGVGFSFTQPIEMRFNELIAGVRSDVGIKLFGDDLETLRKKGEEIARVVAAVPGAEDVKAEQTSGLPVIRVKVDRDRCARYGISAGDVLDTVEAARAGKVVGTVFEGQQRFALVVRFDDDAARTIDSLANVPVASPGGASIPLG